MNYHQNPVVMTIKNLSIHIGENTLLDEANLTIHQGERIGLIGKNGSGKTTLLRVIAGNEDADKGEIEMPKDITMGYLPQDFELDAEKSVLENIKDGAKNIYNWIAEYESLHGESKLRSELENKIMIHDGWNLEERIKYIAKELEIDLENPSVANLSGGEKRRVALARAIISQPDLLILDEPTNHLDTKLIEWIENYLANYPGTCILVTHDRYFLDRTASRIIELSKAKFHSHVGNYSNYLANKARRLEIEGLAESRRLSFLRREYEWVKRGPKGRTSKNKGRLERYHDTVADDGFEKEIDAEIIFPPPPQFSKRIIELKDVTVEIGNKKLFENFSYSFNPAEHIGIVGPNGAGKTTLIKTMIGELAPNTGTVQLGNQTQINYFDQTKVDLNEQKTVFEEIGNGSEHVKFGEKTLSLRGYLKRFMFTDNRINTKIEKLSGGEKSRLLLAKILRNGGNFIILDEPTNDLDLPTLRVLEETLINFKGCVVVVSHDRYFLNRVCDRIFAMEGDGKVKIYEGNYDDYRKQKDQRVSDLSAFDNGSDTETKVEIEEKIGLTRDEMDELKKIEKRISNAENKVEEIEQQYNDPDLYTKHKSKVAKLTEELQTAKAKVAQLYARWEELEGKR